MDALWRDIRYAVRVIRRSPLFALTIILSIGLGIGANTTVFTWVDSLVRNPFPAIPAGGSLVAVNSADADGRVQGMPPVAYPTYEEWRGRLSSFTDIAAHAPVRLSLRTTPREVGDPVWVELVSRNFFDVVQVKPYRGRFFAPEDEASRAPVAVLGYGYWQRRFGGDPGIVGRTLILNGAPLTTVGIAPPSFGGVVVGLAYDIFAPVWLQPSLLPGPEWMTNRRIRRLQGVAHLKAGVTIAQAQQEIGRVARQLSESYGDTPVTSGGVRWVRDTQLGSLMGPLTTAMLVVTALVLLIGCANVASLLLARGAERARETAVQLAIGAPRARLVRPLLVQSILLALAGSVVGLWIAWMLKDVLPAFVPRVPMPVLVEIDLNPRVIGFAIVAACATALLFGLIPALAVSRPDLAATLKGSSAGRGSRRARGRQALVVAQVAFSVVSLSTSALFLRSAAAKQQAPLGFGDPAQVLLASTDLGFTGLNDAERVTVVARLLDRMRSLPGVRAAGMSTMVPLGFGGHQMVATRIDGYTPQRDESMTTERVVVSDGYFETMEIPILHGRGLGRADAPGGLRVTVVSEAFVSRYWPGQNPIGRRIDQGDGWAVVVGVARNAATQSPTEPPPPLAYHVFGQAAATSLTLHARTAQDPKAMIEAVRREFAAVHADLPVLDPGTLTEHMAASVFVQYVGSSVLGGFGILALLITGTGLYGVLAYAVVQRRREIAITVALGATPRDVATTVLGGGLRLAAAGVACGLALAVAVAMLVRSQLAGVSPTDAVALSGSLAVVGLVVVLASVGPAWRAVRMDPIVALRAQ